MLGKLLPLLLPKTIQFVYLQNAPEYQTPPLSCLAMYLLVRARQLHIACAQLVMFV